MLRSQPLGAVILAGTRGRRMGGAPKAFLRLDGETFLERLVSRLSGFEELLLAAKDPSLYTACGLPSLTLVEDSYPGSGPMVGLCSALRFCRSDALVTVACDMPLLAQGFPEYLATRFFEKNAALSPASPPESFRYDAAVTVDRTGRIHPLCGVYAKSAADVLERFLAAEDFRMMKALAEMRVLHIPLTASPYTDDVVSNINTPEEYEALLARCATRTL